MKKVILIGLLLLSLTGYSQSKEITIRTDSVYLKDTNLTLNFNAYWKINNNSLTEYFFNKEVIYPIVGVSKNTADELSFLVIKNGQLIEYKIFVVDKNVHIVSMKKMDNVIVTYDYY
jgi:hypothetical protein